MLVLDPIPDKPIYFIKLTFAELHNGQLFKMVISENLQNLKGVNWKFPKIQSVGGKSDPSRKQWPSKDQMVKKVNESQLFQSKDVLVNEGFDQILRANQILWKMEKVERYLSKDNNKYLVSFDPDLSNIWILRAIYGSFEPKVILRDTFTSFEWFWVLRGGWTFEVRV